MKGHSEEYLGEERDVWWNQDYFDLLAKRWKLDQYSTVLDVGCGLCHWSKKLLPYLKKPANVTALDYDPKWAAEREEIRAYFKAHDTGIEFLQGDACQLPFASESFAVVTCQTLLIHLQDPLKALLEMKRVLQKGGLLLCAEPNNLAGNLVRTSIMEEESIEETLERIKFNLIYEKGKKIMGEGDNSFGDFLPGYFARAGLTETKVYLSDRGFPIVPPYASSGEMSFFKALERWAEKNEGPFDYHQALRYFKAVSEDKEHLDFFHRQWRKNKDELERQRQEVQKKRFHTGGAAIMYLVSGRK